MAGQTGPEDTGKEMKITMRIIRRFIKDYYSPIGVRIVLPLGALLISATLLNLYRQGGWIWLVDQATDPWFWATPVLTFVLLGIVLSEVIILPLKRFELHLKGLKEGKENGSFGLKRSDELGYLAERFNALHAEVSKKIETRDLQLSVLGNFMKVSSGVFDVNVLMSYLFSTLNTAVDFDAAAYMLLRDNKKAEGTIFTPQVNLNDRDAGALSAMLFDEVKKYCPDFPDQIDDELGFGIASLKVSQIDIKREGWQWDPDNIRTFPVPLVCYGKTIGVVTLIISGDKKQSFDRDIIDPMVHHASTVLERLLTFFTAKEKRLQNILSSMGDGVYIVDEGGRTSTMNDKALDLVNSFCDKGTECVTNGFGLSECPHPEDEICNFGWLIRRIRNEEIDLDDGPYIEEMTAANGRLLELSVSNLTDGHINDGYVITARDVSEDRTIQKQLFQTSKLAALGEMAAGIAHEINNPLQIMMGNVEILELELADEDGSAEADRLVSMKEGIGRVKKIIQNLLVFAREQTTETAKVEINPMLEKSAEMLRDQLKLSNISLDLELDPRSPMVKGNVNLLQQVAINLIQNARDAMEESGKGSVVYIRTSLLPAGEVVIEIADNGPGIPADVAQRIFDPFFTTKDVGKGTGLGLSVSRKIVETMGGTINVSSHEGEGTTFYITLKHDLSNDESELASEEPIDVGLIASKKVLMIDDEVSILRAVSGIVGPKCKSFETSADPGVGLEIAFDEDFDIILLDIKMPGLSGMEFYRRLKERKPYLAERVIFLTGDTESEQTQAFLNLTNCKYISKPFEAGSLFRSMTTMEEVRA